MKQFYIFTIGVALILLSACEKATVGEDLLPDSDKLNVEFNDTTLVVSKTLRDNDSIRTDRLLQSSLGSMIDDIFGKTTTGFMTEVRLPTDGFTDVTSAFTLDSVVLSLELESFYGDSLEKQSFIVYKMNTPLDKSITHFHDIEFDASMEEIGRLNDFEFRPSLFSADDSIKQILKIPLSAFFWYFYVKSIGFYQFLR